MKEVRSLSLSEVIEIMESMSVRSIESDLSPDDESILL